MNPIPEYNGFVVIESPSEREIAEALAREEEEERRRREEEELVDESQPEMVVKATPTS